MKLSSGSWLLCILFLALVDSSICQKVDGCSSYSASCATCINSSPVCSWCSDEDYRGVSRCGMLANIQSRCKNIVNPVSSLTIASRPNLDDNIQVTPSVLDVDLRLGDPIKFQIEVQPAVNYPVDLYYLMDLSYSMRDDLDILKTLATDIANEMRLLSSRSSFGFGTFVDKPVAPFMDPSRYRRDIPCMGLPDFKLGDMTCDATYGFINAMPITDDVNKFKNRVAIQNISSNIDTPEGGLDALLQVAVCTEKIGWRSAARHIVVYVSDSNYHYSGDGKLAGIITPNNGQCNINAAGRYDGTHMDYPSLRQLRDNLEQFRILPVFAVTKRAVSDYEKLRDSLVGIGSLVGELTSNSSNVLEIIKNSYKTLFSTVQLFGSNSKNLRIDYDAICSSNDIKKGSNTCTNVRSGQKVTFNVTITSTKCPTPENTQEQFNIRVLGFGDVSVRARYSCECACAQPQNSVPNSPKCTHGNGTYACGICVCNPGRFGSLCQCDSETSFSDPSGCRISNTSLLCNNRGDCQCGACYCRQPENGVGNVFGKYCECDDFSCPKGTNNLLCSGNGKCACNGCQCYDGWSNIDCSCTNSTDTCISSTSNKVCNGQGTCKCGKCTCSSSSNYVGDTCDYCPTCADGCTKSKDCVECKVFKSGSYGPAECDIKCTDVVVTTVSTVNEGPNKRRCQVPRTNSSCLMVYAHSILRNKTMLLIAQEDEVCPQPPNVAAVVAGTIGAVIGVGLALLVVWKVLQKMRDRQEFYAFESQRKKEKWNANENPLYQPATKKYENPMYSRRV